MYNRVLTDADRTELAATIEQMRQYWPEMSARKISQSMVQFAYVYKTVLDLLQDFPNQVHLSVLAAGAYEDIATECLKLDDFSVVSIDPVLNCDLHTFKVRTHRKFQYVVSASVLEHVEDDEEFVGDCCDLLYPGGFGIFTMDFKDSWRPGERVPTTSRRFYTEYDLTRRLPDILHQHDCVLYGSQDYTAIDTFNWEGINYSFATFIFQKKTQNNEI